MTKLLLNKVPTPIEYAEDIGGAQAPSMDISAILSGVLRRWRLVATITLTATLATYGALKLVPKTYKSSVEILVFDPQRQIDAAVQKPISPFVDAVGNDAINTEIMILKSKSVALRVASELRLDEDPEFQGSDGVSNFVAEVRGRIAGMAAHFGFAALSGASGDTIETAVHPDEKAEKLDRAADELLKRMDVWQEAYIITVSMLSSSPVKAQRLASTIANDYLASQREARQEALEHVASWLKGRVDDLQTKVLETESSIEKLKVESGIHDTELDNVREQQISGLNFQLLTAREEVNNKRAHLEQARHVIDTNGDIASIPEVASATLTELGRMKTQLNLSVADQQNKLGEHNSQVISTRAELAAVNKQIDAEVEHILGNLKNAYEIAVRREQSLEANLQSISATLNSEASTKLQQLRRVADADRKVYESYLSQYNDISERRELQDASARIVSPATLPRSPGSGRMKFYALGAIGGLSGGLLLAFLLEYLRPGVKTTADITQSFGLPVVGNIPLVQRQKTRGVSHYRPLDRVLNDPLSHLSEAVHAMRIGLGLSNANPKVILITSALPGEGKSTTAMLLAASSVSSGKRTILLDCDFRLRSTSVTLGSKNKLGLSEVLKGTADLADVIAEDPVTRIHAIPAGSMVLNAADLLMSQGMQDLIAVLRASYDYIVIDAPPLLPVVDALALATVADKILLVVEWGQTPRTSIHEAFRVLGPEINRVAGVVLNKVDFHQLSGYGAGYNYRSVAKYFSNA